MSEEPDSELYHRSTMLGVQFVSDLIAFMIANNVKRRVLPGCDMPSDLSRFPIEIVKYHKIIKVLKMFAPNKEDEACFEVLEQTTDTLINVRFTINRQANHTIVEIEPAKK
jgi:hypothetical protein